MWDIISTQSEWAWFDDLIDNIVTSGAPQLPAHEGSLGDTAWFWYSPIPGQYFIQTDGGTILDRQAVQSYLTTQLDDFGLRQAAQLTVNWNGKDRDQVQAKALRLIRTNKVHVHDNLPELISGTVEGDHGTYQPEITRNPDVSPRNQAGLIQGSCQCDWAQFMNTPRTRIWKQYQSAPCSHLIALWWLAQSMPLDEGPNGPNSDLLQTGQGDVGQFTPLHQNPLMNFAPNMPGANIPGLTPRPDIGTTQRVFSPDEAIGNTAGPGNPESALPQSIPEPIDIDPEGSVPGKKRQSPSNPNQFPGGTYSNVHESADDFNEGDMVQLKNDDWGTQIGDKGYQGVGQPIQIPAGTIGEVRGVHPSTGMLEVLYNQGPFLQKGPMNAWGATAWHFPSDVFRRPDLRGGSPMVQRT